MRTPLRLLHQKLGRTLQWDTTVYFAEPEDFPVNVVGRIGFLDHLQIGIVDYDQLLYFSPYEIL